MTNNVIAISDRVGSDNEEDISTRAELVRGLLKETVKAWLSIAKEFRRAKRELQPIAFECFINKVGITKAVADKLVKVGERKCLYEPENEQHLASVDGWSPLYELAKLKDGKLSAVLHYVEENPDVRLSRAVIRALSKTGGTTDKLVIFLSVVAYQSKLDAVNATQKIELDRKIREAMAILSDIPLLTCKRNKCLSVETSAARLMPIDL